jgi:glycosyltransferase involved in cell wall biosynthesis
VEYAVLAVALVACAWAWFIVVRVARSMRSVERMADLSPPDPATWPTVSLIVPACNEEERLRDAMTSRLADDYPALDAVLVDDRSTDRTGAIADELAAKDPRLQVVHVTELPPGWLGKLHAMHRGVEHAKGEWLLFSDADIHFAQGALRKAVALAEQRGLDHLVLIARIGPTTALTDATVGAVLLGVAAFVNTRKIADPRSREAVGGGIFSLVRRDALAKTKGLPWMKLEVVDDLVLGQMLKESGAKQGFLNAVDIMWLDWYRSVGEMQHAMEKNAFALFGRYRLSMLLPSSLVVLSLTWGTFLGMLAGPPWLRALSLVSFAAMTAAQALLARWLGRRPWVAILAPIGQTLLVWFALRAAWLALWRGGVAWRGTLYSVRELREGSRMRYF